MAVLDKLWKQVDNAIPVPMAAPETPQLKAQRHRLIAASVVLAWLCLAVLASRGPVVKVEALLIVGFLVFVVLEGAIWARRKNAADDAYLDELCRRAREDRDELCAREEGNHSEAA